MTFDEWAESKNNSYIDRTISTYRWNIKNINTVDKYLKLSDRRRYELDNVRTAYAQIISLYMKELGTDIILPLPNNLKDKFYIGDFFYDLIDEDNNDES